MTVTGMHIELDDPRREWVAGRVVVRRLRWSLHSDHARSLELTWWTVTAVDGSWRRTLAFAGGLDEAARARRCAHDVAHHGWAAGTRSYLDSTMAEVCTS